MTTARSKPEPPPIVVDSRNYEKVGTEYRDFSFYEWNDLYPIKGKFVIGLYDLWKYIASVLVFTALIWLLFYKYLRYSNEYVVLILLISSVVFFTHVKTLIRVIKTVKSSNEMRKKAIDRNNKIMERRNKELEKEKELERLGKEWHLKNNEHQKKLRYILGQYVKFESERQGRVVRGKEYYNILMECWHNYLLACDVSVDAPGDARLFREQFWREFNARVPVDDPARGYHLALMKESSDFRAHEPLSHLAIEVPTNLPVLLPPDDLDVLKKGISEFDDSLRKLRDRAKANGLPLLVDESDEKSHH